MSRISFRLRFGCASEWHKRAAKTIPAWHQQQQQLNKRQRARECEHWTWNEKCIKWCDDYMLWLHLFGPRCEPSSMLFHEPYLPSLYLLSYRINASELTNIVIYHHCYALAAAAAVSISPFIFMSVQRHMTTAKAIVQPFREILFVRTRLYSFNFLSFYTFLLQLLFVH